MGKVLPNRLYLPLALKWVRPNFCVICVSFLMTFILVVFKKTNKEIQ